MTCGGRDSMNNLLCAGCRKLHDVAITQRSRQSSRMIFRRPIVPSRIPELALFGVAASGVLFVAAFSVWAASRELVAWHEVPALTVLMGLGSLPMVAMGLWLRRQRLKKTAELQDYECILAAAHDPR